MTRKPTPDILGAVMTGAQDKTEQLDWSDITISGGTQMRAGLNQETVAEYAEAMRRGERFPAIEVFHDGLDYWLADGFHRHAAWKEAFGSSEKIPTIIKPGTRRDAILAAAAANARHGLRRTPADKRRAVLVLLQDDEWSQWSDNEIARRCGVSQPFVSKLRKSLTYNVISEEPSEPHTYNVISMNPAERTFIHPKTGRPATMNTTNIGRNSGQAPAPQPDPAEGEPEEDDPLITVAAIRARARELAKGQRRHFPTMAELFPDETPPSPQPAPAEEAPPPPQPAPTEDTFSDQIARIDDFMDENLPEFSALDGDTATSAIAAMQWMLHVIDWLKGNEPTAPITPTPPTTPASLGDWRDGWNDGDEGEYGELGEYWTVEQITSPRVAMRLYEQQGDEFKPALLRRYQELS